MKTKLMWMVTLLAAMVTNSPACTNLIVGKAASADGSVIVSYSADSFGMFGHLYHSPAATHSQGEMLGYGPISGTNKTSAQNLQCDRKHQ